jgi:hypothetical protein
VGPFGQQNEYLELRISGLWLVDIEPGYVGITLKYHTGQKITNFSKQIQNGLVLLVMLSASHQALGHIAPHFAIKVPYKSVLVRVLLYVQMIFYPSSLTPWFNAKVPPPQPGFDPGLCYDPTLRHNPV